MATFLEILLIALLGMLATSKRLQRLRRWRSVSALMSGGWLWVAGGFLLGPSALGAISLDTIVALTPIIFIGLGWIALMVGMQARRDVLAALPAWVWRAAAWDVVAATALVGALAWIALRWWPGEQSPGVSALAVALLVACAIGWSMETRWAAARPGPAGEGLAMLIRGGGGLASMAAVALFAFSQTIQTPRPFFTTLAMLIGVCALGIVAAHFTRFLFRLAGDSRADFLVVLLAVVSLTAGLGAEIGASPLLAPFLLGVMGSNLAGVRLRRFERVILEAEHVVAAMFATLAGAALSPALGLAGAALCGGILAIRALFKPPLAVMARASSAATGAPAARVRPRSGVGLVRQSPIALALGVAIVSFEPSQMSRLLLGVIVVVGLASEALSLVLDRRPPAEPAPEATP